MLETGDLDKKKRDELQDNGLQVEEQGVLQEEQQDGEFVPGGCQEGWMIIINRKKWINGS